jgi:hypothetical protein
LMLENLNGLIIINSFLFLFICMLFLHYQNNINLTKNIFCLLNLEE